MRYVRKVENVPVRKNRIMEGRVNNPSYENIIKELKDFLVDELGWLYQPDYYSVRFVEKGFGGVIDMNNTFIHVAFPSGSFTCKIKNIETFMTSKRGTGAWIHFDLGDETYYKVDVRS